MAVSTPTNQAKQAIQPLDILLWVILALLGVPLLLALQAVPWAQTLPAWLIPVALSVGLVCGTLITLLPAGRWWAALLAVPGLGIAVGLGALFAAHNTAATVSLTGAIILGAYVAGLGALVPWLLYRARQAWLVVALLWLTLAGAWGGQAFSTQHIWETVWLLALSLGLLGLWHLREEMQLWRTQHLEQIGPVLWPSARTIVTLSIVVAIIGLAPLSVARLGALSRFWNQTPLGKGGPLTYDNPAGAPVAVLGAPLALDAPDVSGNQTILTYTVTQGPVTTPPLLGATLDTFDGQTWSRGAGITTPAITQHLATPPQAQTLTTTVTVAALPATENGSFLLGFDQPLGFSVPTRAQTIGTDAPTALTIAGWETAKPLAKGATYSVTSAIISADAAATATTSTLPTALASRMTAVPTTLANDNLQATAQQWIGTAKTPVAQANNLLSSLEHFTLDPKATPPKGADGISWFLQHKRGNVLLWTTAYIMLARSLGLPMRLAEGYLPGTYSTTLHAQVVQASDATVWAQLAIPGQGWLDLFPAANVQTVVVPGTIIYATPPPQPTAGPTPPPASNQKPGQRKPNSGTTGAQAVGMLITIAFIILAVLLLLGAALAVISWRWAQFGQRLAPLMRFFARVGRLAQLGGVALQPSDTSTQATDKVAAYLPQQQATLQTLNRAYERVVYGPPAGQAMLINLREQWDVLRRDLWRLVVTRFTRLRRGKH